MASEYISSLFNAQQYSDISFQVQGEDESKVFYGHKAIIASRCEYFRVLWTTDFSDSSQSTLFIESSPASFESVLGYFYKNKVEKDTNPDTALEGIVLANAYLLPSLKNAYERALIKGKCIGKFFFEKYHAKSIITTSDLTSVLYVLNMADMHSAHELKFECISFIIKNYNMISNKEEFNELSAELRQEIRNRMDS